jgi:hypothetical protein
VATLEPEPTQHNSLDTLQIRKRKWATVLLIAAVTLNRSQLACYLPINSEEKGATALLITAATLNLIWLVCFLPATPDCRRETKKVCFEPTVWPDTCCSKHMIRSAMDKTYLTELVRNTSPLWDQRNKNYHNQDLKPKLWKEIGEKLNVPGKYWNKNSNELQ